MYSIWVRSHTLPILFSTGCPFSMHVSIRSRSCREYATSSTRFSTQKIHSLAQKILLVAGIAAIGQYAK
jgi:hypothetical protein